MSTQLAVRTGTILQALGDEKTKRAFQSLGLPDDKHAMFCRRVANALERTPKLLECTPESIVFACKRCLELGLEYDEFGLAYLIPRKRSFKTQSGWESVMEAHHQTGYKGWIKLFERSGQVKVVHAGIVYEGDLFAFEPGKMPTHQPSLDSDHHPDDIRWVWVSVELYNGAFITEAWPRAKIDRHKERYSEAWKYAQHKVVKNEDNEGRKDSVWHLNWEKMALKTVIHSLAHGGRVPMSAEAQRQAYLDMVAEGVIRAEQEAPAALPSPVQQATGKTGLEGLKDAMRQEQAEGAVVDEPAAEESPDEGKDAGQGTEAPGDDDPRKPSDQTLATILTAKTAAAAKKAHAAALKAGEDGKWWLDEALKERLSVEKDEKQGELL